MAKPSKPTTAKIKQYLKAHKHKAITVDALPDEPAAALLAAHGVTQDEYRGAGGKMDQLVRV
jgi:hypothetical protein